MRIDHTLVRDVVGIDAPPTLNCTGLGLVNADVPGALTFIDDRRYLAQLIANPNIGAVLVTAELAREIPSAQLVAVISGDPRWDFFTLLNHVGRAAYRRVPSQIDETAVVHPRAFVSEYNVRIGPGTILEPNATVLADVEIGARCIIRAGAVLGAEGFEHKRTTRGILSVFHDGKTILGDDVEIGSNGVVCKGFAYRDTVVGDSTKIDKLTYVAHAVHIGSRCLVGAVAMISGSATLGDDVWVGPSAAVSSQVRVGARGRVSIGAVATRDVPENETVSGNFAIAHDRFLEFIRSVR